MTQVSKSPLISSSISQIRQWFQTAVPSPTTQNIHTQIGVNLEETAEMLSVLRDAGATFPAREQLGFVHDVSVYMQRQLKTGRIEIALDDLDRVALLDALCDQIVTAVGIAQFLNMDIEGALKEVADSNDSKFDHAGQPIFNDQKKIMKGPGYRAPDLSQFV